MEDSDDDNWEEVLPAGITVSLPPSVAPPPTPQPLLQITLRVPESAKALEEAQKKQKAEVEALQRFIRLQSHRLHTVALLANASIRNKWINDDLLHARLMSLTPLPLQTSFTMITKKNQPDASLRGRQFEVALHRLAKWWSETFKVDYSKETVRHRTFDDVASELATKAESEEKTKTDVKGKGKARARDSDDDDDDGKCELIRSSKSFMKHALMMRGSRDTSAQLFAALCRSLNIPTRLVVSLQSVLWRRNKSGNITGKTTEERAKSAAKRRAKEARNDALEAARVAAQAKNTGTSTHLGPRSVDGSWKGTASEDNDDDDMEEVLPASPSSKGKGKVVGHSASGRTLGSDSVAITSSKPKVKPIIRLRKTRPKGRTLGEVDKEYSESVLRVNSPPVFWVEVFSKPDGRWLVVDPLSAQIDKKRKFEPSSSDKYNHMLYVVGFEEDGYIRDVTPRYAKSFGTKILKERRTGVGKKDWWPDVMRILTRPFRLHRDDVEEAEFEQIQALEGMPSSIGGFKDHPLYALERHLKTTEVIHPLTQIGTFRGEPVYPRANVTTVKSSENWMRVGRVVKEGDQPLKMTKVRAVTLEKKRAVEQAKEDAIARGWEDAEGLTQGLYAEWQTVPYIPDPIIDGKVPKNDFGNIDLYVPSMLPRGGVHVPYKGTAKIARQLGIDYAEAVTAFEFKQRRAIPVLTGIVIPAESESQLLEVYWESTHAAEEKERQKKQDRVLKHWTRLVQGLRTRKRLNDQFGEAGNADPEEEAGDNPPVDPDEAGGFFAEDQTGSHGLAYQIAPYALPKNLHVPLNPVVNHGTTPLQVTASNEEVFQRHAGYSARSTTSRFHVSNGDAAASVAEAMSLDPKVDVPAPAPKTLAEFVAGRATSLAAEAQDGSSSNEEGEPHEPEDIPPPPSARPRRKSTKAVSPSATAVSPRRPRRAVTQKASARVTRPSRKRRRDSESSSLSDISDPKTESPSPPKKKRAAAGGRATRARSAKESDLMVGSTPATPATPAAGGRTLRPRPGRK